MASKSSVKSQKDRSPKQNGKTYQDALPDEIALRDEILDLKRQMMVLKKTNEQNLVKFRKYEDEAKRKDRQIEQLMDPTKNTDIRKILSTKGAAILMNLKDQNNALIQMILDKDLQIKRLLGELKTSKLYATSRKTEPYRIEIARLRNLLIKSQELLKEATDVPQKRSICVGGTPILEMTSSSSDQSSPRELEELRFTIQSLETHMKYSNELLAKKNQEIMILTDQLNAARNAYQCNTCNKTMTIKPFHEYDLDPKKYDWFEMDKLADETRLQEVAEVPRSQSADEKVKQENLPLPLPQSQKPKSNGAELLELFEKTMAVKERKIKTKIPKSAPVSSGRNSDSKDSPSRRSSMPVLTEKSNGYLADESNEQTTHEPISTEGTTDLSLTMSNGTSEDLEKSISKHLSSREKRRSKSLLHDLATNSFEETERKIEKIPFTKEKWRNAVKKLKKSNQRKKSEPSFTFEKTKNTKRKSLIKNEERRVKISDASGNDTELEELETHEFEMMEKKIEHDQIEIESIIKSNKESPKSGTSPKSPGSLKLKRQNCIIQTEDAIDVENKCETPNTARKSKELSLLPRRSSTKGESPGKSKPGNVSSRKSSTSSTAKSTSSKSESSSKKSVGKSPRDLTYRAVKKLSRSKNVEETPTPLRRTKITKSVSLDKVRGSTPSPPIPLSRRHSDQTNAEVEKPVESEKAIENLDEIIKYEESSKPVSDTQHIKEEINNISSRFSPEIQKELQSLYDNITSFEEIEKKQVKSLREVYKQSVDSSFDSENSSTTRHEPKIVEVEIEINQAPMQSIESTQSQDELLFESTEKKDGGENFFDDDDDDDVILG